jgi:P27 family predicted phage terminase small subunit
MRRPKPTALKVLQGNPGKRRLDPREPKPPLEIPPCPEHLSEAAKAEWQRMSEQLYQLGLLTALDLALLAAYCQAWGRWLEAERHLEEEGAILASPDGGLMLSPWIPIAGKAMNQMHRLLVEFGMTPSSRTRIRVSPPAGADAFDELLKR